MLVERSKATSDIIPASIAFSYLLIVLSVMNQCLRGFMFSCYFWLYVWSLNVDDYFRFDIFNR